MTPRPMAPQRHVAVGLAVGPIAVHPDQDVPVLVGVGEEARVPPERHVHEVVAAPPENLLPVVDPGVGVEHLLAELAIATVHAAAILEDRFGDLLLGEHFVDGSVAIVHELPPNGIEAFTSRA